VLVGTAGWARQNLADKVGRDPDEPIQPEKLIDALGYERDVLITGTAFVNALQKFSENVIRRVLPFIEFPKKGGNLPTGSELAQTAKVGLSNFAGLALDGGQKFGEDFNRCVRGGDGEGVLRIGIVVTGKDG
jgi:hypothetical protein